MKKSSRPLAGLVPVLLCGLFIIVGLPGRGIAKDGKPGEAAFEPVLRIPKVGGALNLKQEMRLIGAGTTEWLGTSAASGFVLADEGGEKVLGLVPGLDASLLLAYNEDTLFVGFLLPVPRGVTPLAQANANQQESIANDDHFVLRLSFEPRADAATKPSFEFRVNSAGFFRSEEKEYLPGQTRVIGESLIRGTSNLGRDYMSHDWWSVKLAIPISVLGKKSLDGATCLLQAGFRAGDLRMMLPGPAWKQAFAATFDPKTPLLFSLNGSSPGLANAGSGLGANWTLRARQEGSALISGVTKNGDRLFENDEPMTPGKAAKVSDNKRVPKGVDQVTTTLAWKPKDGIAQTIYAARWPVLEDPKAVQERIANWASSRTVRGKAGIQTDYVFDPYSGNIEVFVNRAKPAAVLDEQESGKMEKILAADTIRCAVKDAAGKVLAESTAPIAAETASVKLELGAGLPDGEYRVVGTVASGGAVLAENELPLIRKKAVWEKNSLGKDPVVFPPFREITRDANKLRVVGREYSIGENGLPQAVASQGKAMLGGPIRLEATSEGRSLPVRFGPPAIELVPGKKFPEEFDRYQFQATSPVPKLEPAAGYQAKVSSTGEIGGLQARVAGTLEFEGLYRVTLTLDAEKPVKLDSLDLVIPLNSAFNTMRFTRQYGTAGAGKVPDGDGVLFSSSQMPKVTGVYNSFVPSVYVGDYLTGLWWMAESDKNWISDDRQALVQLERIKGQLQLRVRFVGMPAELSGKRTLSFALLASPTAPVPDNYRRREWSGKGIEPLVAHDTSGYRYYGTGVNGFELYTDEDYAALKDYLYTRPPEKNTGKNQLGQPYRYGENVPLLARKGLPVILYGSIYGASSAMEEFPAYGSGWTMTARTAEQLPTDETFRGRTNYGGNRQWLTDEQVRPVFVVPTDSFYDAHLYHMVQIATKSGVNGHFHDNYQKFPTAGGPVRSDVTGAGFRRPDGLVQAKSVVLDKHDWNKRFYTALWLAGRPPQMLGSNEQNNAFKRVWFVEGISYVQKSEGNYITQGVTPDIFRGFTSRTFPLAGVTSHIAPRIGPDGKPASVNQQATRMVLAYGLLHDIGIALTSLDASAKDFPPDKPPMESLFNKIDQTIGFLDGGAKVLPYWQDRDWIESGAAAVTAGAIVAKDRSRAVLVAINSSDKETPFAFRLTDKLLGKPVKSVQILETGAAVKESSGEFSVPLAPYETVFLNVD